LYANQSPLLAKKDKGRHEFFRKESKPEPASFIQRDKKIKDEILTASKIEASG